MSGNVVNRFDAMVSLFCTCPVTLSLHKKYSGYSISQYNSSCKMTTDLCYHILMRRTIPLILRRRIKDIKVFRTTRPDLAT